MRATPATPRSIAPTSLASTPSSSPGPRIGVEAGARGGMGDAAANDAVRSRLGKSSPRVGRCVDDWSGVDKSAKNAEPSSSSAEAAVAAARTFQTLPVGFLQDSYEDANYSFKFPISFLSFCKRNLSDSLSVS